MVVLLDGVTLKVMRLLVSFTQAPTGTDGQVNACIPQAHAYSRGCTLRGVCSCAPPTKATAVLAPSDSYMWIPAECI